MSKPQKLQHAALEQAIYGKHSLAELLANVPDAVDSLINQYQVADYIGSHTAKTDGYAKDDLRKTVARVFFEDDGGYKATIECIDQPFNLAIFATFIVIEINPNTAEVEFLVLIPQRPKTLENARYAGLMKSQNTDQLLHDLNNADHPQALQQVTQQIQQLLAMLREPAVQAIRSAQAKKSARTWFKRLFQSKTPS
ncbi:MAG: hypothetical protein ACWA5U_09365 [bacterium]